MIKHLTLGENKNAPRIWIEGNSLSTNEFEPGMSVNIEYCDGHILIRAALLGSNTISAKRGKPVLDINNRKIRESLGDAKRIKVSLRPGIAAIYPLPSDEEIQKAHYKAESPSFTSVDLFSGIGTQAHAAERSGIRSIAAVEFDQEIAEQFKVNFPHSKMIAGSVTDVTHAEWEEFADANVVITSPPCPAFSNAGKAKRGSEGLHDEEHDSGFLGYAVLEAVKAIRPSHVVIENVATGAWMNSGILTVIKQVLRAWGYIYQHETVLDGKQLGDMTIRKRYAGVFTVKPGFEFNLEPMRPQPVSSILEVPLDERDWLDERSATVATFIRRTAEHEEKNRGFRSGAVPPSSCAVPTITAGYARRRLTDGMLHKEGEPNVISFFTQREAARIHGISDSFVLPESKTAAFHGIGNGVSVRQWMHAVFLPLVRHLKACSLEAAAKAV